MSLVWQQQVLRKLMIFHVPFEATPLTLLQPFPLHFSNTHLTYSTTVSIHPFFRIAASRPSSPS